jgi:hypothetical protein
LSLSAITTLHPAWMERSAFGTALGIDLDATLASLRRRFAYACLDWSERRPHHVSRADLRGWARPF